MCSIAGVVSLDGHPVPDLARRLEVMNRLQAHRGPDGQAQWQRSCQKVGLAHCRLAILDPAGGTQPMGFPGGTRVVTNAQFYNHPEVRRQLIEHQFLTRSDTETLLAAFHRWGSDCLHRFRGMFSFALWDEANHRLFCARDRFGIKPFYYAVVKGVFYCASEAKALLPFLPEIATDSEALREYLSFQYCLEGKTLFRGIRELLPGHTLTVADGKLKIDCYWDLLDVNCAEAGHERHDLRARFEEAVQLELRSDVPVGLFLSGGLDSSLIASEAARNLGAGLPAFHGRFAEGPQFDESRYARELSILKGLELQSLTVTAGDFLKNFEKIIYHLDFPAAGPGCIGQFMVAKMAAKHRKVVLCGQGGDELFGGYARYRLALGKTFPGYEPAQETVKGITQLEQRYYRLINRAHEGSSFIRWDSLKGCDPPHTFLRKFSTRHEHPVERMVRYDLKESLRSLLQVEDRVCMAHGLESRAPLLDHHLAEYALSLPSSIKFDGEPKFVLKRALGHLLPDSILARRDKMGFPIPLNLWLQGEAFEFVQDRLGTTKALTRDFVDNVAVLRNLRSEALYSRSFWGFLCLEIWQQTFHDQAHRYLSMMQRQAA